MDFSAEIKFNTARSGGKGGQNVNKVETMVEGYWHIASSAILAPGQKELLGLKLKNNITNEGYLLVKSSKYRNQLSNKQDVVLKMQELVKKALHVPKKRKPTRIPEGAKQNRLQSKKRASEIKQNRRRPDTHVL